MKKFLTTALISTAMAAFPVFGHHAAEGMVDAEVYAMIDDLLADTPHADMTIDDIATGMTEVTTTTTIETRTVTQMENLVDDGILDYAAMLDGDVEVNITFSPDGDVTMTIIQTEAMY